MESARSAYDRYAPVYDEANAQNNYEMWLGEVILPELEKRGLQKGWALDIGCGTGRAFDPLLERGWQMVGCDVSPKMLIEANRKFGSRVRLHTVDARDVPPLSPEPGLPTGEAFDLVILLNDVVNYMVEDGDLELAFASVRRNLRRDHGLAVFDVNTLGLFRAHFATSEAEAMNTRGWNWQGMTDEAKPGIVYEARLWGRDVEPHLHRQRHWTAEQIRGALESSGLRCLAALGQREEGGRILLSATPDEERDHKIVYIAAHAGSTPS
jgi:SAM-dependent methyltransferase